MYRSKKILLAMILGMLLISAIMGVVLKNNEPPVSEKRVAYKYHVMNAEDVEKLKNKIGVRQTGKNYNVIVDGHGTGLAPPTEEEYQWMVGHVKYVDSVENYATRGSVDLSQSDYFPPVGNQGQQGSCASWTSAYYNNGYHQAYIHGWSDTHTGSNEHHLMSPSWVYNKINNGTDGGSDLTGPYKVMMSVGDASLATMPYNDQDYTSWGDEAAWREAPIGRIQNYEVTSVTNIDVIKSWLDQGDSLMSFAINANSYDSAFSDGNYIISWQEYQQYQGSPNHGQTIVGYDDSITDDGDVGAFKVVNSWGSSWGDNGFYWITYNAFQHLAWDQVIRITGDTPNNPHLLAVWQFGSPGARDASVTIGIGDPNNPVNSRDAYLYGGTSNFPNFMAMDMSDFEDDFNNGYSDFFLCIGSKNAGSSSSTISLFKIEYYANDYDPNGGYTQISNESPDVPKTTPGCVQNSLSLQPLSITLLSPHSGDIYAGGENIEIEWSIHSNTFSSNQITVNLYYSYSGSGGWKHIATTTGDKTPYPWTLPKVNATDFQIRVNASDPDTNTDQMDSGYFTVDSSPPAISDTYPQNGQVHVSQFIPAIWVNFTEDVNLSSVENNIQITPAINYTVKKISGGHIEIVIGKTTGNSQEGTTPASTYGDYIDAQTFEMSEEANITSVDIYMLKEGSPPADCRLQIVEMNSGKPNGNVLGEASVSADTVSTSFSWVTFTFPTPVHLNANTQYALVLNMSGVGDSSNRYRWGLSDDVYSNGNFWQHSSSGWQEFSNYDGSFVIHYGNLENNTLYTVTIGNGVKDMAGNPMKEDYQFQFSTGAAVPEFSAMLPLLVILLAGIAIIKRRF